MEQHAADVLVIGSGPAGQKAAIQCAKLGKKVILVERDSYPGGASLNSGTIPSKSLREAILDVTSFYERSFYGRDFDGVREASISDLNYRLNKVLEEERRILSRHFRKNDIKVIQGSARFEDRHTVIIESQKGEGVSLVRASKIIVATGSKPRQPLDVPFDDEVILDSKRLLNIGKVPKTMLVLGGGIIGAEYASFFAALGTQVTVMDKRDHILPLLDAEIGIHLQKGLTDIGLRFVGNKKPEKIERINDRAVVTCSDGIVLEADVLLFALGRVANVDSLHIEKLGMELSKTGHLAVNALFQTSISNIYGAGDVIGGPALASTSMEQGRLAARHACGVKTHHFPTFFPLGIYTIPEISCIGYTEEELQDLGFHYEVGRAYYYEISRSHIAGSGAGLFKILFHSETLEMLGIHIIGQGATEVIHIGQVAMSFNAHVDYFIDQVFNYPTYAEGYRVAALNGFNKIKHRR